MTTETILAIPKTAPLVVELEQPKERRLHYKSRDAARLLSIDEKTLWQKAKEQPALFAPIRHHRGNIYVLEQIEVMALVLEGKIKPEAGAECWRRIDTRRVDAVLRKAGDKTRGRI